MHDSTHHKLAERVKELTALHRTARLLQDENRDVRELLQEIVNLLPPAWQYPEVTEAAIRFRELHITTAGFQVTDWLQSATFVVRPELSGVIQIVYLEERPPEAEGVFLAEERELIESLADMLGTYFQHQLADAELQEAHENLERLVAERTAELRKTNEELAVEIEHHRATRKEIEEYQQRLRQLATEVTLAEAKERREIAVDLHDHIGQEFAFIKMRLQQFKGDAVFCGFEHNLEEIIRLIDSAIRYTRSLTFQISTPILYELGLAPALEWLAEKYQTEHRIAIHVQTPNNPPLLPEAIRVMLFKSVQELLNNIVKYASATRVTISLHRTYERTTIIVSDNGCGFDVAAIEQQEKRSGFGLFSIRERLRYFGGEMLIHSAPTQGTTITLTV